jgi:hypothetical protein
MTSAVFLTAAVLALGGAVYKACGLRGQPAGRPVACVITWFPLGLALALRAPVIAASVNKIAHVRNLSVLAGNSLTLISTCSMMIVLVYFTEPAARRGRRKFWLRLGLLAGTLSCMISLFVWSLLSSPPVDFLAHRSVQSLAYVLIYLGYLAAGMADFFRLFVRHVPYTSCRYLFRGLWLMALGSALGILYCAVYGYSTVAAYLQLTELGPPIVTTVLLAPIVTSVLFPSAACVLLVMGSTAGGWGPCLRRGRELLEDYRSYLRLGPLWQALAEVAPEAIPPRDMTTNLTIGQKRYRRIIEIRDMILTLHPYRDPVLATDAAAALAGAGESSPAAAAGVVVSAILARREGRLTAGSPGVAMAAQPGADLAAESHWLEAVSAALTTFGHGHPLFE